MNCPYPPRCCLTLRVVPWLAGSLSQESCFCGSLLFTLLLPLTCSTATLFLEPSAVMAAPESLPFLIPTLPQTRAVAPVRY